MTKLICAVFVLYFLAACAPSEEDAALQISAFNLLSEREKDVKITLYLSEEDWKKEQNPYLPAQKTNDNGLVRFIGLPAGTYYIDAVKETQNNWEGKKTTNVRVVGSFFVNDEVTVLTQSLSGFLSQAAGKNWLITSITSGGVSVANRVETCFLDNAFVFFKGGKYQNKSNTIKCNATETDLVDELNWKINATNNLITFTDGNNTPRDSWRIIEIASNSLKVQRTILFGGSNFNVEITFSSQ